MKLGVILVASGMVITGCQSDKEKHQDDFKTNCETTISGNRMKRVMGMDEQEELFNEEEVDAICSCFQDKMMEDESIDYRQANDIAKDAEKMVEYVEACR